MLAKICGVKSVDAAKHAVEQGADFIGVILVPNRKRSIDINVARQISDYLRSIDPNNEGKPRPKLVGVFRNQSIEDIRRLQEEIGLDAVQLHGSEPFSMIHEIEGPVIRRIAPTNPNFAKEVVITSKAPNTLALVDSEQGGDGKTVDWSVLSEAANQGGTYILAGGLTPENVRIAASQPGCIGVDVSGGVENENGDKDFDKIKAFLASAKGGCE